MAGKQIEPNTLSHRKTALRKAGAVICTLCMGGVIGGCGLFYRPQSVDCDDDGVEDLCVPYFDWLECTTGSGMGSNWAAEQYCNANEQSPPYGDASRLGTCSDPDNVDIPAACGGNGTDSGGGGTGGDTGGTTAATSGGSSGASSTGGSVGWYSCGNNGTNIKVGTLYWCNGELGDSAPIYWDGPTCVQADSVSEATEVCESACHVELLNQYPGPNSAACIEYESNIKDCGNYFSSNAPTYLGDSDLGCAITLESDLEDPCDSYGGVSPGMFEASGSAILSDGGYASASSFVGSFIYETSNCVSGVCDFSLTGLNASSTVVAGSIYDPAGVPTPYEVDGISFHLNQAASGQWYQSSGRVVFPSDSIDIDIIVDNVTYDGVSQTGLPSANVSIEISQISASLPINGTLSLYMSLDVDGHTISAVVAEIASGTQVCECDNTSCIDDCSEANDFMCDGNQCFDICN